MREFYFLFTKYKWQQVLNTKNRAGLAKVLLTLKNKVQPGKHDCTKATMVKVNK